MIGIFRMQMIVEPNDKDNFKNINNANNLDRISNIYSDDDDDEDEFNKDNDMKELPEGRSRYVIKFLISKWPVSLCCENKFKSTPVGKVKQLNINNYNFIYIIIFIKKIIILETVLEKTKLVKSKIKVN
jgi:hypothetical protein